jgi:hypothetical protein
MHYSLKNCLNNGGSLKGQQTIEADPHSVRARLQRALAGQVVDWPVYAAYDWFVKNRPIDWPSMFAQGLGQINHADLVLVERPHLQVVETNREIDGQAYRVVRWITDRGELRESFLGEWRQEYFIKRTEDYCVMLRAFEDTRYTATKEFFQRSEDELGNRGITLGALGWAPLRRTPLLEVQIEFTGPERFALDLADGVPGLMELLELLSQLTLDKFREAVKTQARYIKLWENLTIEMLGARQYREHLVPLYRQIFEILDTARKRLVVHYDGKLRVIAQDIANLDLDGIDSFTPPPEGDMSVAEARAVWPDKFLWLNPSLGWYLEERETLIRRIRQMARDAGPSRFCLMISEDVPPAWQQTIPAVLEALRPAVG